MKNLKLCTIILFFPVLAVSELVHPPTAIPGEKNGVPPPVISSTLVVTNYMSIVKETAAQLWLWM
ncbi:hypothetical protein GWN42_06415 [candidate division KSB1 bacterium]|nr:hypothetical protein [candidate division KSB1 bacterium]